MRGRPAAVDDLVTWLGGMPTAERERVARLLTAPDTVAAVRVVREDAIAEMLAEPGATWASVARAIGASTSTVNKMVTSRNARRAIEAISDVQLHPEKYGVAGLMQPPSDAS